MVMMMIGYSPSRYLRPWIACLSNSAEPIQIYLSLVSLSKTHQELSPCSPTWKEQTIRWVFLKTSSQPNNPYLFCTYVYREREREGEREREREK